MHSEPAVARPSEILPLPKRGTSYHIPEEHAVIETLNDRLDGPAPGGGVFAITDLDNYYMPLIRYQNGDAGVLTDAPCPCGRTLKRIEKLYGRISDFLRGANGETVWGGMVDYVMSDTNSIREYCLIQEEPLACQLLYVAEGDVPELPTLIANLQQFLGEAMKIQPVRVDAIPLTRSGKRRFTICRLEQMAQENAWYVAACPA